MRDDEVLATFVGRFVPVKRLDLLMRAFAVARAEQAPVVLALVGDGDERPKIEALARELDLTNHVRFLGYRGDMPMIAAAGDLAVLSSDNEGTPVSLIEAAASGSPAVATDVGGVSEVVAPSTGRLVPAGDWQALGAEIAALAADKDQRATYGARATGACPWPIPTGAPRHRCRDALREAACCESEAHCT